MAKAAQTDNKIDATNKRESKVKGDKASGKVGRGNAKTNKDNDKHEKFVVQEPVLAYSGGNVNIRHRREVAKETKIYYTGSVLKDSAAKSENKMTIIEKMEATRSGISKKQLEQLKKRAELDYDQLSYILHVARATLIAKKGSEKFSSLLSEKIMSVADIYSYGYEVFGSNEEFNKWIFQPIAALGGKPPYEILDNQYGREEVKHIIGRIEYGVYS